MGLWDKFVVLEGLDGSGTTTQLNRLASHCRNKATDCIRTFEPSDGFIGQAARAVLEKREKVHPLTLAQLFAADRREHVQLMTEELEAGKWVFCDRYLFSSLAYQSLQLDFETVLEMNREFPLPGYCLYLECSVETSSNRRDKRESIDLFEKEAFQRKVISLYEKAFTTLYPDGNGFYRINGEDSADTVFLNIIEILGL
jgi:dTMP kinase